jgi:hypothetical protein
VYEKDTRFYAINPVSFPFTIMVLEIDRGSNTKTLYLYSSILQHTAIISRSTAGVE